MNVDEILNEYLNLDMKNKILFKRLMNEYEELEKLEARLEFVKTLKNIENENGEPYLSLDWIKKNILKI
jgi:predicted RNase H-like nuclease (RuvC/YqgF family)